MSPSSVSPEFLAEAQEIVDALNRDLIAAESEARKGEVDPDRVNNLFRSAHTLKGISSMFGFDAISRLAHSLEGVLDGMRLGRVHIDTAGLDVLFACVERFALLVAEAAGDTETGAQGIDDLMLKLDVVARGAPAAPTDPLQTVELGEDVLSVLTEYEEHRLKENIRRGRNLYVLRTSFDLSNFDLGLAELDGAVKSVGEVITKLPSAKGAQPGFISFDIIVGADCSSDELVKAIGDDRVEVLPIQRRAMVVPTERPAPAPVGPAPKAAPAPSAAPVAAATRPEDRDAAAAAALGGEVAPASGDPLSATEEAQTVKSVSQTVRVDIRRLDKLMNLVGELALTKTAFLRISEVMKRELGFTGLAVDLHKESRNFERRLAELQAGIMEVRMVPLANLFERMVRVGRKIGRELGRQVRIEVSGENTELDKLIVEDLADPLMHLIRNAIDHGIESPEERLLAGKSAEGVVRLAAEAQGNHVIVEVSDDGRGVDVKRTVELAVQRKLVSADRTTDLSKREIYNLLFLPGFSTRAEVSEYSGRGVGLDIVKTNISQLSGVIDMNSTPGKGTSVAVTLPITLAIIPALIVSVVGKTYAIPLNNVLETLAIDTNAVKTIERREVISVRGSTVPLVDLRQIFNLKQAERPSLLYGVVAGIGQHRMALLVDELVGQQDIVIKSLGRRLRHVPGIAGATELGNQQTILVIDMVELINEMAMEAGAGDLA
jgi:two-component system, chemotaxis family, sensor kinase CheA